MSSLKKFDYRIKDNRKRNIFLCGIALIVITIVGVKLYKSKAEFTSTTNEMNLASGKVRLTCTDKVKPGYDKPLTEYVNKLYDSNVCSELANDNTTDKNIRYIGASPDNYVDIGDGTYDTDLYYGYKQNFDKESLVEYTSLEACQKGIEGSYTNCKLIHKKGEPILWRIIGVMNNVDDGTGTKETRIKLIRDEDIGNIAWDAKCNGIIDETNETCSSYTGENNWTTSTLKTTLNEAFLNSTITTERNYTSPYEENENRDQWKVKYKKLDFSKSGIKNKELITNAKYYLNQFSWTSPATHHYYTLLTKEFYNAEGTRNVKENFPEDWTGMVGLIYPSDYGFATSGGTNKTREECLNTPLYANGTVNVNNNYALFGCHKNNWIFDSFHIRMISPVTDANNMLNVRHNGVIVGGDNVYGPYGRIKPVVYLKSNTIIKSGTGNEKDPFVLTI